jgi:hypothetical protein
MAKLDDARETLENAGFDIALMHAEPSAMNFFIPSHHANLAKEYVDQKHHVFKQDGIELTINKIRGGIIITAAIRALNELNIPSGSSTMSYKTKLDDLFNKPLAEEQYHSATAGMNRTNQSTRQRQSYTSNTTHGGVEHPVSPKAQDKKLRRKKVTEQIAEAIDGIATPTGTQPVDLFNNLIAGMDHLGDKLGIGSIRNKLAEKGINFKKSKDNTAVIFYVMNATTNSPQPIARISIEQLEKPHEFETTLLSLLDLSRGDAPGALKQQQELLRAQEQAVREVAKSAIPQPEEEKIA